MSARRPVPTRPRARHSEGPVLPPVYAASSAFAISSHSWSSAAVEGVKGDRLGLVGESADLLYHLLVMWTATGVTPDDVGAELTRRENLSGIAEKKRRKL
jgi:hypothetical protein